MTGWTAILLAGSRPGGDPFARSMGAAHKALISLAGEPMLLRPLRALLASSAVGEIVVLTQQPGDLRSVLPRRKTISLRASEGTIAATLAHLVAGKDAQFPMLVTTADHALLDTGMVAEFTRKAAGADLAIAVVEKRLLQARFPQSKRTWLNFRGGSYSGANLFAIGSRRALAAIELWRSVEQDRKKGWRVLAALGPVVLLGALLRLRGIDQTARGIGRRLGLDIRICRMSNPIAAIDVDKPEDHALVESIIAGRA